MPFPPIPSFLKRKEPRPMNDKPTTDTPMPTRAAPKVSPTETKSVVTNTPLSMNPPSAIPGGLIDSIDDRLTILNEKMESAIDVLGKLSLDMFGGVPDRKASDPRESGGGSIALVHGCIDDAFERMEYIDKLASELKRL